MNKNRITIILLAIFILVSLLTLTRNPLLNDDAALYGLAIKNTALFNQWLAPLITPGNLNSYLDKPLLGLWLQALPLKVLPFNEFTLHLPNFIYYCLLLGLLYALLKKLGYKRIALNATLVSATSLALIVFSRTPKMEILTTIFVLLGSLLLFDFLKKNNYKSLYLLALCLSLGFLVKTGLGVLFPALTLILVLLLNSQARQRSFKTLLSQHFLFCLAIFLAPLVLVFGLQKLALGPLWSEYLKTITIQSKYNTAYLGLNFNLSSLLMVLIVAFPWTAQALAAIKLKTRLTLSNYLNFFLFASLLFIILFYNQTDFRTFTSLGPVMAVLAALRMESRKLKLAKRTWLELISNNFFLVIFVLAFVYLLINPYNADGINLSAVIPSLGFFALTLFCLNFNFGRPKVSTIALVMTSYIVLFYFSLPLARSFNPESSWPKLIKQKQQAGYSFYVYRPPERNLIMSPDLTYPDCLAGPADKYFWQKEKLLSQLKGKVILLSDTKSLKKLPVKIKLLAQDDYATLAELAK